MSYLHTEDDVSIFFEDTGSGVPIMFVHEFGGDYRSWTRQVEFLATTHRCITFSARGFWPSSIPEERSHYGQDKSTSDVLALIDHLQLKTVHLVGCSMGSFTSLDVTLKHPQRVLSLTLIGNSSGPRDQCEREHYRGQWIGHELDCRQDNGGDGAVELLSADPAYISFRQNHRADWECYTQNLRQQPVSGAIHILSTVHWNRHSLFAIKNQLKSLETPVLLVTGKQDYYLVGETNQFLERTLPDSTWIEFEHTGHLVNIERATEFNTALLDFISRFKASSHGF